MQDTKKTRAPRTEEHKAKLAAAYEAKREHFAKTRVNSNPKLVTFVTDFLYPLLMSFTYFAGANEMMIAGDHIKLVKFQKVDKQGKPVGRVSCSVELSVLWLEQEHGRTAAGIFKKLFKRTAKGGWSTTKQQAYTSSWVINKPAFDSIFGASTGKFSKEGRLEVYQLIQILQDAVEFQYLPTRFICMKGSNGLYRVVGDKESKRMVGPDVKVKIKVDRDVVKARCEMLNEAIKQQMALQRAISLELEMKLRAVTSQVEKLKVEAGVTE